MNAYRFEVTFDTATLTFKPITGSQPFPVSVIQGISLITFDLVDSPGVEFSTNPIQWVLDGQPTDLPPWFLMHRHDASHFALWDFNSSPVHTRHEFALSVFYAGQFYSSHDPVIVNEPPSGGY